MMVGTDLVSGAVVCGAMGAVWMLTDTARAVAALCGANLLLSLASAGFVPAVSALIPDIVDKDHVQKANAAHQFTATGARICGQAAGSLVYSWLGIILALGVNGATFFISAATEAFIRAPAQKPAGRTGPGLGREFRNALGEVWKQEQLKRLVILIALFHFFISALPVCLPFLAQHRLGLETGWVGFLYAAYTGGIMAGFMAAGALENRIRNRGRTVALFSLGAGVLFSLAGLTGRAPVCGAALLGVGLCIGVIVVNLITEAQLAALPEKRGRVMGAVHGAGGCSLPLGMAFFGLALDGLHQWGLPYGRVVSGLLVFCGVGAAAAAVYHLGAMGTQRPGTFG